MTEKDLEKYGEVKKFEVTEDKLTIKIGEGFSSNAMKTMAFMKEVSDAYPEFDVIDKCITDDNICHYVLKKKKQ